MKWKPLILVVATAVVVAAALYLRAHEVAAEQAVAPNGPTLAAAELPTLIELGSDRCVSCRAMIPVLEELRTTQAGHLNVRFIDVWDHPTEGERYGVKTIPTQLLLAPDGRELRRHTGFWSARSIRHAFASKGYPLRDR